MYELASEATVVACAREVAFDYAADLENFVDWFPGVLGIASADQQPFGTVGKLYLETVAVPLLGRRTVPIRVVAVDAPARLITQGELPLLLPRMEIEFRAAGAEACEITWRMVSRNDRRFARYTVLPLAARLMQRRARAGLRALTRNLEDTTPRPSRE